MKEEGVLLGGFLRCQDDRLATIVGHVGGEDGFGSDVLGGIGDLLRITAAGVDTKKPLYRGRAAEKCDFGISDYFRRRSRPRRPRLPRKAMVGSGTGV